MIRKLFASVAIATLIAPGISSANETFFSPEITASGTPGTPWTFSGSGNVQRGLNLNCDIEVVLKGGPSQTDSHGAASHTDVSDITGADFYFYQGDSLCSSIGNTDRSSAGPVEFNPVTHEIKLHNTKINTITLGYCEGTLSGILDPDTHEISFSGTLPGFDPAGVPTPGLPCVFSGSLVHSDATHNGTDEINEYIAISGHTYHTHTH